MSHYVLALPSWYPSKVAPFNGDFVQRHVQAIAPYHQQHVLFVVKQEERNTSLFQPSVLQQENLIEKIIYYRVGFKSIKPLHRLVSHFTYLRTYKKALEAHFASYGLPQLVHVHVCFKAGYLALWLKKKYKLKIVFTEHYSGFTNKLVERQPLHFTLAKKVFTNANFHMAITQNLANIVHRLNGADTLLTAIVPNAVNTLLFSYKEKPNSLFTFCHVSNLSPQKNIDGIIEACCLLQKKGIAFQCHFIGAEDALYTKKASSLGLLNKQVFFTGAIAYEQVALALQQHHALVMLSLHENLPCTILEALCCGTPVISSNVGGIAEVIEPNNGVLVAANAAALATAMEEMIENYQQYNLPQIAIQAAAKFSFARVGQQVADVYNSLIN